MLLFIYGCRSCYTGPDSRNIQIKLVKHCIFQLIYIVNLFPVADEIRNTKLPLIVYSLEMEGPM